VVLDSEDFRMTFEADSGSVVVNLGVPTGREATQAELDRLAVARREAGGVDPLPPCCAATRTTTEVADSRGNLHSRRMAGHIVAMGGGGFFADPDSPLDDFMLSLSSATRPRVCFVPTPAGDSDRGIAAFFEAFSRRDCKPSCLRLFGVPERPVERLAAQDVIYVSGGNTANALAIWRLHGVDEAVRRAWERGAVLGGVSAGANCWFECSVTDSYGSELAPLRDGLGILPGSFCPHYDGEELRRPVYRRLVDNGFPAGYAAEDGAALHFAGTELREVVSSREGARAYRVEPGSETPLDPRPLP
jgi:dipeptidase E